MRRFEPAGGHELVDVGAEPDPVAQAPPAGFLARHHLRPRADGLQGVEDRVGEVRRRREDAGAQRPVEMGDVGRRIRPDLVEVVADLVAQPRDRPVHRARDGPPRSRPERAAGRRAARSDRCRAPSPPGSRTPPRPAARRGAGRGGRRRGAAGSRGAARRGRRPAPARPAAPAAASRKAATPVSAKARRASPSRSAAATAASSTNPSCSGRPSEARSASRSTAEAAIPSRCRASAEDVGRQVDALASHALPFRPRARGIKHAGAFSTAGTSRRAMRGRSGRNAR